MEGKDHGKIMEMENHSNASLNTGITLRQMEGGCENEQDNFINIKIYK